MDFFYFRQQSPVNTYLQSLTTDCEIIVTRIIPGSIKSWIHKSSTVWFGFHFFNWNNSVHFFQTAIKDNHEKKQKYR